MSAHEALPLSQRAQASDGTAARACRAILRAALREEAAHLGLRRGIRRAAVRGDVVRRARHDRPRHEAHPAHDDERDDERAHPDQCSARPTAAGTIARRARPATSASTEGIEKASPRRMTTGGGLANSAARRGVGQLTRGESSANVQARPGRGRHDRRRRAARGLERGHGWRFERGPGASSPYYAWWWVDQQVVLMTAPSATVVQYPHRPLRAARKELST